MLVEAKKDWKKYKVFFNEVDISEICTQANDTEGWADVIIRLGTIQFEYKGSSFPVLAKDNEPVTARITGKVSIVERYLVELKL